MSKFLFNPYHINETNDWFRFISSGFVHADWGHLLFNMLVLFFFGETVEAYYDHYYGKSATLYFMVLYLGAFVFSHLPTYWRYKDYPSYNSLGASGATVAVLFAFIFFDPWASLRLYFFIPIPAIVFGILYLGYSAMKMELLSDHWLPESIRFRIQAPDNVNHEAHFYGAVWGILFSFFLKPQIGLEFIEKLLQPHF